jgi:hypothetical protein
MASKSGRFLGNSPECLLESLGRLTTRDEIAPVNDHRWHVIDTPRSPKLLSMANLLCITARGKHLACSVAVKARFCSGVNQHLMIGGALALREISVEQRVLQCSLPALVFSPM